MEGIDQGGANQMRERGGWEGVGCRSKDREVTVVAWNGEHGRSTTEKKKPMRGRTMKSWRYKLRVKFERLGLADERCRALDKANEAVRRR